MEKNISAPEKYLLTISLLFSPPQGHSGVLISNTD